MEASKAIKSILCNDPPELSILLPAYNEAENLLELLPQINDVINDLQIYAQVIVIDTIEPLDDTRNICNRFGVEYLHREGGNQYGDAIRTGILATNSEFVISMDSDGSHNPEFIRELWAHRKDADVVIASRYIQGGKTDNPWILVAMSQLLNKVFRVFVKVPALDVSNSFRLYRGELLRSIHPKYQNFDILEEILVRILWEKRSYSVKILEIPFLFEQRKHGKPKRKLFLFSIQYLLALVKLSIIRIKCQFSLRS